MRTIADKHENPDPGFDRAIIVVRIAAFRFTCLLSGILFALAITAILASAQATEPGTVTQANWQQHPKIKTVRGIVEAVNTGLSKGAFKISQREFEYCESYEDTLRKMAVNPKGIVRMFEKQAGSDDSALTWKHFYDEAGRLRFVFITGGAANGAQLEHRIYLDEGGKRIWEDHKYVKGPEYSFPEVWPDEQLQKANPAGAFAARSPCPALRAKKEEKTLKEHIGFGVPPSGGFIS